MSGEKETIQVFLSAHTDFNPLDHSLTGSSQNHRTVWVLEGLQRPSHPTPLHQAGPSSTKCWPQEGTCGTAHCTCLQLHQFSHGLELLKNGLQGWLAITCTAVWSSWWIHHWNFSWKRVEWNGWDVSHTKSPRQQLAGVWSYDQYIRL